MKPVLSAVRFTATKALGRARMALVGIFLAWAGEGTRWPATPAGPAPNQAEHFKAILSNPPVIREMVYLEKLPTERDRPPSLEFGISASTNYSIGWLVWQPDAMAFRTLSSTNLAQERGVNGPAFFVSSETITFVEGPTNILVYKMEHDRVKAGEFPPAYDAATYRMRRSTEPLNLGLSHLLPGSVRWDGDRFQATGSADKKPIRVTGEISSFTNGLPSELRVHYTSDQVSARYRIAYTYARKESPWFPETITLYFLYNGREVEYRAYRILSVSTSTEPLPAAVFDPYSYLPRKETVVSLATNDSTYVMLPNGRLLETPSGVSPKMHLTERDYYRNHYTYLTMAAVTVGFCVLIARTQRNGKTPKTR